MALLPKEPKQQKALIALVILAAGVYEGRDLLWVPKSTALDEMQMHVDTLTQKNNAARIMAARGTDLEARNAIYERHLLELEKLVPQKEEVPQLIRSIGHEAQVSGVTLADLAPEPDQVEQYYVKKAWTMGVWGEYDAVGRFLASIASMSRIITPMDLDIGVFTPPSGIPIEARNPVSARLRIEVYVLPDPNAPADSAAAPAVP